MILISSCGKRESEISEETGIKQNVVEHTAAKPYVVKVMGLDYAFSAPLEIPSGWTTFRFINRGKEPHHMVLLQLADGYTRQDFLEAFATGAPPPDWITLMGGANGVAPSGESNAVINLKPGSYVLACFIPSPDKVPHLMKGMTRPLIVTEESNGAPAPDVDIEMALTDYAFDLSAPITVGEHTIRVTNEAEGRPHEVLLVRLHPGKNVEDVAKWMHTLEGPPPAEFLGGASALSPGQSSIFTASFKPGTYAWLCPMIEHRGATPHTALGMMQQFTVE